MISMPPSDSDLHAYVDRQLSEADQRLVQAYLANQPEVAARVRAWQQDAQHLRTALSGALQQPPNPDLDPAMIRQHLKHRSRRHLASAAVLLLAVSVGGVSGWQARQMTLLSAAALMADALQAYRLIAQQGILPADYQTSDELSMQGWLDRYFTQADLAARPVGRRLQAGQRALAQHRTRRGGNGGLSGPERSENQLLRAPTRPEKLPPAPGQSPRGRIASRVLVRAGLQLCDGHSQ